MIVASMLLATALVTSLWPFLSERRLGSMARRGLSWPRGQPRIVHHLFASLLPPIQCGSSRRPNGRSGIDAHGSYPFSQG